VHGIIKGYGGEISVYSEIGKGTKFSIHLPAYEVKKLKEQATKEEILGGSESVLLVDDESTLVKMNTQLLERLGYNVSGHTSSSEALQVFRASPDKFDLVISDQTMPNLTGAELANELLQIKPDIPIILITGYSDTIDKSKAKKIGIKQLVMKPYLATDLSKIIRDVLDNQNGGINND
jgi:CheY-like chemotaxis protein